jgi:LysM repeat protein
MKNKFVLMVMLFLGGVLLLWSQIPVAASRSDQVAFPSPTPGPDGRIIYIVKAGETCTQLSLLYGVSLEYIRTTNNLDANCTIYEGQKLMIGVGGPSSASPTPGPSPTPTPIPATPTQGVGGSAQVCVLVYDDANGDALRQTSEGAIAGAAISLTSQDGKYSQTITSVIDPDATAYQGMCFDNVPPGTYSVSAAAPEGYNPTIALTTTVEVNPGDSASVDFGAQARVTSAGVVEPAKGPSPLLGIAGAALLLVGIGIGAYTWKMLRK